MNQITETIDRYVSIWNEADFERRRELIVATWTEDGTYRDPMMSSDDHAGFDGLMNNVRTHLPGHTLQLTSVVDIVADHVRFSWALVNDATGEPTVTGIDFGAIGPDGRLRSIVGFYIQAPVLAGGS